jgi:hypothetical protein
MLAGAVSASAAGARNWELWSGAAEQEELMGKVVERMKEMGFSEQRMKVRGGAGIGMMCVMVVVVLPALL